MKTLVFDTSSIISLVTNDLLHVIPDLKQLFNGEFCIPESVRVELVDKPLASKKYKLEAMMINGVINTGIFQVNKSLDVDFLLNIVNNIYSAKDKPIHILDRAEIEAVALAVKLNSLAYVVDERTMRLLVEDPAKLGRVLSKKLHTKITMNTKLLKLFKKNINKVKIIRSTELMTVAFEKGLLDKYIVGFDKKEAIDAILWGLRLRGCAISSEEITDIIKITKN